MHALRSKYAIRLSELIQKRVGLDKNSEVFTPDEIRAKLGVPKGKLKSFGEFNKHCLQVALAEVNQLMDYSVEAGLVKKGRTVVQVILTWQQKDIRGRQEAYKELERHRAGRKARREMTVERVVFGQEE